MISFSWAPWMRIWSRWTCEQGRVRWDVEVADYKAAYSITAAPLVVKDKIIVGIAGAEYGIRGFLDAYDAKTGKKSLALLDSAGAGRAGQRDLVGR